MSLASRRFKNIVVLDPRGRVTGDSYVDFNTTLEEQLDPEHPLVVINLRRVSWINSTGLGILISVLAQIHQRAGHLVLAEPKPRVQQILATGRFPMEVFATEDEAKERLIDWRRREAQSLAQP